MTLYGIAILRYKISFFIITREKDIQIIINLILYLINIFYFSFASENIKIFLPYVSIFNSGFNSPSKVIAFLFILLYISSLASFSSFSIFSSFSPLCFENASSTFFTKSVVMNLSICFLL